MNINKTSYGYAKPQGQGNKNIENMVQEIEHLVNRLACVNFQDHKRLD